ncbi:ABC transporter ATP-binding protein [Allonocardiopsis opalescens]|uniref:ATP-binding cassette subfamily B protein n=1 Tax=Allonocardiopsis opalescens TaxID=1144618 RepID=A0A2T0Q5A3_9ACTN|nr:ABC transporter ATP-binding protein [Allonocardiopsis opalescens]PRX98976.1 ATP-binding cassette subfamily B protein [Allonocardiopsis opalescens]
MAVDQQVRPATEERPAPEGAAPARGANIRLLWAFVRPHRAVLGLGVLLGLVATGADLATPLVAKWVLDAMAADAPVAPAIAVLAGLLVVGAGIGLVQWIMLGRLGERVILDVRTSMVARLFRLRVDQLAGRSSGEFVTRVTSDTVLMRETVASSIVQLVNGTVGLVGALTLMALLDWVLLAATLGTLVVIGTVVALLMPSLARAQEAAQAALGRLGGALEGGMRAIRTVKAARAEHRESERVITEAREAARQSVRAVRVEAIAWTATGGGISLAIMLILGIGAYRVGAGVLAVSALVAFLLYAFQLMGPAMELSTVITQFQSGIAAAARVAEVQRLEVEHDEPAAGPPATAHSGAPEEGGPAAPEAPVLAFHEVEAGYRPDAPPALAGVSIQVPRIGHTAIVGPSGAGKTTMFSLILRFLHPRAGEITLEGRPLETWSLDALRGRIAYVEQDTPLLPGTLAENLRYSRPDAPDDALWAALRAVRLAERARSLPQGLDTPLSADVVSGGERQRIAIARALVAEPAILLLDEATAQLDGLTEAAVQRAIRELAERGAVVTIAHRLSTVVDADQIIVLEAGRCRATGTHAELLATDALYQELVTALRIAAVPPERVPAP